MTNGTISALTDIAVLGFTVGVFGETLQALTPRRNRKRNENNFFS